MKQRLALLFFSCCILLQVGCSAQIGALSPESDIVKSAPVVYVHPLAELDRQQMSIGVLSFQVPANVAPQQGAGVAGIFRDVLLGKRTFRAVKLIEKDYDGNVDAVAIGKENGVDLVLAGRINYFLSGYELGGDRVDLSVRLLDVASGNTVWFIEQTADKAVDYPDKSFSNRLVTALSGGPAVRPQTGAPRSLSMLVRVAEDMSDVVAGARTVSRN